MISIIKDMTLPPPSVNYLNEHIKELCAAVRELITSLSILIHETEDTHRSVAFARSVDLENIKRNIKDAAENEEHTAK